MSETGKELNEVSGSSTILPPTPTHLRPSARQGAGDISSPKVPAAGITVIPETPPKTVAGPARKRPRQAYTYEVYDGWIHCRVPVKPAGFGLSKKDKPKVAERLKFDDVFEFYRNSVKHLYKKEQRYPCPDCKAWYEGDAQRIQFSCRHRQPSESEEALKIWDICFPESDNDDLQSWTL